MNYEKESPAANRANVNNQENSSTNTRVRQGQDHLKIARSVLSHIGPGTLLTTATHTWHWKASGVWRTLNDRELKKLVQNALDSVGHTVSSGLVNSVTDVLKSEALAAEHQWNVDNKSINFLNGELHWLNEAWQLRPHNRENYRTTQIPYNYDRDSSCPRFLQFLGEVFANDSDADDKITLVAELLGYTLSSSAEFEKFVLLLGNGANGKSVLLDVVRQMAGSENVAAVQPSQFGNRFQRAYLHLKLVNLVTEIAEGAEIADAELKSIVSGELTTAEHKHQSPFSFRPFATCWFGSNHMPHTRDFSDALFRRAIVIPFNRTFQYGVDADPDLKSKLTEEIPGIISLGLKAYGKALMRGEFTEPYSSKIAKQEWRLEADQVEQFFTERCRLDQASELTSREVYQTYKSWAAEAGIHRTLNKKNFTQRLTKLGVKTRKTTGGTRMISGMELKCVSEEVA